MPKHIGEEKQGLSGRLTRGAPLAAIVLVALATTVVIAYQALPILKLIAVSMLLALVLRTIINGLERLGAPNWLAVLVLIAGLAAFAALMWFVVIPNVVQEARRLVSSGPGTLNALADFLSSLPFIPDISEPLQRLENYITRLIGSLSSLLFTAASVIVAIIAAVFLAIYFAVSPGSYVSGILKLVPVHRRGAAQEFIERLGRGLRGWIVGTVIVSAFVGAGAGLGLWLLGVPLPLTFGIIAGILNVIPYLGSIVGGLLPALLALTISPVKALLVVVLFLALNQIEGNLLRPVIMGREVEVPPAMVLSSILLLGSLLGIIIGALLAVPAAVLVKVVTDELAERSPVLGGGKEEELGPEDGAEEEEPPAEGSRDTE